MLQTQQPGAALRNTLLAAALICENLAMVNPLVAQSVTSQSQSTTPSSSVSVSVSSALAAQSPYLGSVPAGGATGTEIPLSIRDALERGLKYNLGLIESDLGTRTARAKRLKSLSDLLPNISAFVSHTVEQINLKALGINFNAPGIPVVVGPFAGIAGQRTKGERRTIMKIVADTMVSYTQKRETEHRPNDSKRERRNNDHASGGCSSDW